jgi:hypothetical protein
MTHIPNPAGFSLNSCHAEFLEHFDEPQEVEIVCRRVFGWRMYWAIPEWIDGAAKAGWIVPMDNLGPVCKTDPSRGIYPRTLMLTDKGREQLGLPIARPTQPKSKPNTLFD